MVKQLRKTIYVTDKRVQHEEKQLYAYCKMSKDVNRVNRCMSPRQLGIYRLRRFYMSTTLYVHCERSTVKKFEDVVMDDIEKRIGKMESTYFYSLLAPVNRQPLQGSKETSELVFERCADDFADSSVRTASSYRELFTKLDPTAASRWQKEAWPFSRFREACYLVARNRWSPCWLRQEIAWSSRTMLSAKEFCRFFKM